MIIVKNPSVADLYKAALKGDAMVSSTGALVSYSGKNTGRRPDAKRIVKDDKTANIDWDANNAMTTDLFMFYLHNARRLLDEYDGIVYQIDTVAGWDHEIKVRIYCTNPYHALFMKNMLIPAEYDEADFEIYNVSHCLANELNDILRCTDIEADPKIDENLVAMNVTEMKMVIYGTKYAGEMKKGVLTLIMYLSPVNGHLPLHSSCNIGEDGDATLFFGLSGTGKTTLSTEPNRRLIGDDEHVWTDTGIYNVENGNYAKCIGLKKESEPEIYNAIRFGAVVENVELGLDNEVLFDSSKYTQNTRCAYPLKHIDNAVIPAITTGDPKNIVLLTCDAFGIFPPVSRLTIDQAVFFFIAGYTSKMPGTEVGITEPKSTFSACFGGPFLAWKPTVYGNMLRQKLEKCNCNVWLVNTGWINGRYGVGSRISIKHTRQIIDSIHDGSLSKAEYKRISVFDLEVPKECGYIPKDVLDPSVNYDWTFVNEFVTDFKATFIKRYGKDIYDELMS